MVPSSGGVPSFGDGENYSHRCVSGGGAIPGGSQSVYSSEYSYRSLMNLFPSRPWDDQSQSNMLNETSHQVLLCLHENGMDQFVCAGRNEWNTTDPDVPRYSSLWFYVNFSKKVNRQ